jgi:hypothetical protein
VLLFLQGFGEGEVAVAALFFVRVFLGLVEVEAREKRESVS